MPWPVNDWGEALAAGAIILDESFDDDDWGGSDGDDISIDRGDRNISIGGGDREINSLDGKGHDPEPIEGGDFRILRGQGRAVPGGAYSYLISGNMVAGHAVIAPPPAVWGDTGIVSFMVAETGIVPEADLGGGTLAKVHEISIFDPGEEWLPVE